MTSKSDIDEGHDHLSTLEVTGGEYKLDGRKIDMSKDTAKDEDIRFAIETYHPADGEYTYDSEHRTISPAGERSGTGDAGITPGSIPRKTVDPVHNSADGIDRNVPEDDEN